MDDWTMELFVDDRLLRNQAATAARMTAIGGGDHLVVIGPMYAGLPATQDDDGVVAMAAIDLVRALASAYDEQRNRVE